MICPNCKIGINLYLEEDAYASSDEPAKKIEGEILYHGFGIGYGFCPECDQFIVLYKEGFIKKSTENIYAFGDQTDDKIIFPLNSSRSITDKEIPDQYKDDFNEAAAILSLSPKASAAITRRLLQNILRNELKIKKRSLADEIEEFIHREGIPSYITDAVDAVRTIGNFATHPLKDQNTGEIIEVEPGEADWLLDVLYSLFDFLFIQPKRLEEKRTQLNKKLSAAGKPEMKKLKNA